MRILLTNSHLQHFGGSETYTLTMYEELKSRGHDVDVFTFQEGEVSKLIPDTITGISNEYDLAIVFHNDCLKEVLKSECAKKVVFTCHGILPGPEEPAPGADKYIAVSEEVQNYLKSKGYHSEIIRNGISLEKFKEKPSKELKKVLYLTNYGGGFETVKKACDLAGAEIKRVGLPNYTKNVAKEIQEADLVVTVGRGSLESLACGKNVVIYDHRSYNGSGKGDGFFTEEIGYKSMQNNYSGRKIGKNYTPEELAEEIKKFDGKSRRYYINKNHNIKDIADKYLNLFNADKKRCLVVTGLTYYASSFSLSGIIKAQCKMLKENGHKVSAVVVKGMHRIEKLKELGIDVFETIYPSAPANKELFEKTYEDLKSLINDYDVVFTHDFIWLEYYKFMNDIFERLEKDFPEKKFVHHSHSAPGSENCPDWKKGRIRKNVLYAYPNKTDLKRVAEYLQLPVKKMIPIKFSNDFMDKSHGNEKLYRKLGINNQELVGFYPAHPLPGKNVPALLKCIQGIKRTGIGIKYIFTMNGCVGGNKNARVLGYKQMIKDYGIEDNVVFMNDFKEWSDVVNDDDVEAIWRRTNLFIMPSLSETTSLILLEAMAHKCIVVANNDFKVFKEICGDGAIYHSFGSHFTGGVNQTDEMVDELARVINKFYVQSHCLYNHFRINTNYSRDNVYKDYTKIFDGSAFIDLPPVKPNKQPKISVIIPIFNVTPLKNKEPELIEFTKRCIDSVKKYYKTEIILINNNPDDKRKYGETKGNILYPIKRIDNKENVGVSKAWNQGIREATGDYIMILNSDTVLPDKWEEPMIKMASKGGIVFTWIKGKLEGNDEGEIPADKFKFPDVHGCCFMAHKSIFNRIGTFDEQFFAYWEDRDYWHRAKLNGIKAYRANVTIEHKMNGTSSKITKDTIKNKELLEKYKNSNNIISSILTDSKDKFFKKWGFID